VVTRTFSKVYGLAGLRVGYGIANPETAATLRGFASDMNVNSLAILAAQESLEDEGFFRTSLDVTRRGKEVLMDCCRELGIEAIPSHTNFQMHRIVGDLDQYIERMKSTSVRVGRPFPPLLSYNRVSIGTAEEMKLFAAKLRQFRKKGWI